MKLITPEQLQDRAEGRFPGIVHYVDGPMVLASRGAQVLRSNDRGTTWHHLWTAPVAGLHRLAGLNRLTRRLTRSHIHHIHPLTQDRLCIVGFRKIYTVETKSGTVLSTLPLDFSRPLALCPYQDRAFFGEYEDNPERGPVHVWGSAPGGTDWEPVWTFDDVRHIHGIYPDPYSDALWITTGDLDIESGLWRTTDQFRTVDPVRRGGQQARIVQPLFSASHVYFGTDAPAEPNHIYRIDRVTGAAEQLQGIDGPVFWGCQQDDSYFFSTVAEPSVVNETGVVTLWHSNGGESWRAMALFRKDRWPMKLFQYGQVRFPVGPGDPGSIWLTPFATQLDQWSLRISLELL